CKGASWRPQGLFRQLYRYVPRIRGGVSAASPAPTAGNHEIGIRQYSNASGSVLPPYLRIASNFLALNLRPSGQGSYHGARLDGGACHVFDHEGIPSICPLRSPASGPCILRQRELDDFRGLIVIVGRPDGRHDSLSTSMDTCADAHSVITKATASSLGFKVLDESKKCRRRVAGNHEIESLGSIVIPMRMRCERGMREVEFDVFEDLAGHRAILSSSLTKDLGHLIRLQCAEC
ncbi:hypothetical protein A1O1_09016, partial [Capronia coronata CBS 617.96]